MYINGDLGRHCIILSLLEMDLPTKSNDLNIADANLMPMIPQYTYYSYVNKSLFTDPTYKPCDLHHDSFNSSFCVYSVSPDTHSLSY